MLLGEGEDDEGKLASLREEEARTQRHRRLEAAHEHTDERDHRCLERVDRERAAQHELPRGRRNLEVDREAGGDEEEAEQQPAERGDVRLDLVAVPGLRQEDPCQEGSESIREPEGGGEARHRQHGHEGDREEGGLVTRGCDELVHGLEEHTPRDEDDREGGGRLQGGEAERRAQRRSRASEQRSDHEQRHDSEVLEEQDAERRAAKTRGKLALLIQELDDEGRGREGEAAAENERRRGRAPKRRRNAGEEERRE
mmetsp:Transcript_36683/g.96861  ORF Transcript_36683/g.96861 Transcript_36683/m.96861 type:complete len:255 (-) Transcript_36683:188-952(-)